MAEKTPIDVPALDDWYTLQVFAERNPNLGSVQTWQWQLRHRNKNGLAPAVRRFGKNLFLSESRVARWLALGDVA
jgi:hypothetical protein